jgi:hypothetical protein
MTDHDDIDRLAALDEGRAYVDLSAWRLVAVAGADAVVWLHDLLTADIEGLEPGGARRSLLLTPTGRIRADVQVLRRAHDLVLAQDADQQTSVADLLMPYVLSSDVALQDVHGRSSLISILDERAPTDLSERFEPSILGQGCDVLVEAGPAARALVRGLDAAGYVRVDGEALDAWRIRRGQPWMGRDFDETSLPAEAGLEGTIDVEKGCFLGQEAVARVRNLGHPPRVLRFVRCDAPLVEGEPVLADGGVVGEVTSATGAAAGSVALARVRWDARAADLTRADGRRLLEAQPVG